MKIKNKNTAIKSLPCYNCSEGASTNHYFVGYVVSVGTRRQELAKWKCARCGEITEVLIGK